MYVAKIAGVFVASLVLGACATAPLMPPWLDRDLNSLVSPSLEKFRSAEDFDAYRAQLETVLDERTARADGLAALLQVLLATIDTTAAAVLECGPTVESCEGDLQEIVVSASKVVVPSITNNQEAGVDEGDIVKQFGRFLIVLHDGRLFSVDTTSMTLVDRVDVYRVPERGTWYDELLIADDHLIVTGYDYDQDASELAIFRIDERGVMEFDATYYITSDDYYSSDNYASRLVDGHLVLYTPLYLYDYASDEPVPFPRVRRWTEAHGFSDWRPLFGPADIYRPIQSTFEPTAHIMSVCPLGGTEFSCQSTGVIGPPQREFYVSPQYAYLWVSFSSYDVYDWDAPECGSRAAAKNRLEPLPAALYRVPLFGGPAEAVLAAGSPRDQFSLDARDDEFLALLYFDSATCFSDESAPLRYARIPNNAFSSRPAPLSAWHYSVMPTPSGDDIENRFTERYLVYGGSQGRWGAYYSGADYEASELVVVPVDDPRRVTVLPLVHSAERVETFGENVIVDGYWGAEGLSISAIDLTGKPRVADVEYLERVIESEGRSHAFNGIVEEDGRGYFGLPTIFKRNSWRDYDEGSNVHFFAVERGLDLRAIGYLAPGEDPVDADYECEVSCVDWYGNARPIFTDGRIFALTGTELIEGYFAGGSILERQRVNLTAMPLHRR